MRGRHVYSRVAVARRIDPLEVPNYTLEEASRYLHVSNLRYWVLGDERTAPLTTVYSRRPLLLSFKNLVECYVLESLRQIHDISLQRIRKDLEELRREKRSKYPLAEYQLSTRHGKIYLEDEADQLISLSAGGQGTFEFLRPYLRRVERNEHGIASTLFPFTRRKYLQSPDNAPKVVVINPGVSFGMPVLAGSRISTAFLLSRHRGGTSIPKLAADYGRPEAEVEEAIEFEKAVESARAA